ncbi:hypothetical protein AX16_000617 [Volvariella volvacea WC 439]|nr:hypothetical protein AX16_000617 [Volvariella volvacea WC 439]
MNAPRPPNAFMLFRSDQWAQELEREGGPLTRDSREFSRIVGYLWKNVVSKEVKTRYTHMAEERMREHRQRFPHWQLANAPGNRSRPRRSRTQKKKNEDRGSHDGLHHNIHHDGIITQNFIEDSTPVCGYDPICPIRIEVDTVQPEIILPSLPHTPVMHAESGQPYWHTPLQTPQLTRGYAHHAGYEDNVMEVASPASPYESLVATPLAGTFPEPCHSPMPWQEREYLSPLTPVMHLPIYEHNYDPQLSAYSDQFMGAVTEPQALQNRWDLALKGTLEVPSSSLFSVGFSRTFEF